MFDRSPPVDAIARDRPPVVKCLTSHGSSPWSLPERSTRRDALIDGRQPDDDLKTGRSRSETFLSPGELFNDRLNSAYIYSTVDRIGVYVDSANPLSSWWL